MCKVLLAVFLALSLATSASTPLENGFVLTTRLLPSKQIPVYNTAFDDDQRGFNPFILAIQYFPFHRGTLTDGFLPAEMQRHFYRANSPTAKLSTVLLI
jgi:hypothetical protein